MRCDAMRCNVMAGGAATNHYFLPTYQPNLFYAATTCSPPSTFSGWWARFTSGVATGPSTQTRCTKPNPTQPRLPNQPTCEMMFIPFGSSHSTRTRHKTTPQCPNPLHSPHAPPLPAELEMRKGDHTDT